MNPECCERNAIGISVPSGHAAGLLAAEEVVPQYTGEVIQSVADMGRRRVKGQEHSLHEK